MTPSPRHEVAPSRARSLFPVLAGAFLLAVSLAVMASWLLREPGLVPVGGYRTVFNTALCFGLVAVALLARRSAMKARIQAMAGTTTLAIAGVVLELAGLVALRNYAERATGDNPLGTAHGHAAQLVSVVDDGIADFESLANRPGIVHALRTPRAAPRDAAGLDILERAAERLIEKGLSRDRVPRSGRQPRRRRGHAVER